MGYDLQNEKGNTFRFSIWGYSPVLTLAEEYGWEPKGTVLPHPRINEEEGAEEEWDGGYFTNDGQTVKSEDAKGIAEALTKALDDISDVEQEHPLGKTKGTGTMSDIQEKMNELHSLEGDKLLRMFSGEQKKAGIRKFIGFLQEGSYVTW